MLLNNIITTKNKTSTNFQCNQSSQEHAECPRWQESPSRDFQQQVNGLSIQSVEKMQNVPQTVQFSSADNPTPFTVHAAAARSAGGRT